MGRSVHTTKKNTKALVVASKETELLVIANRDKCMVMSRDQNTRRSNKIKTDSKLSEGVEHLKNLEKAITNQNSIQK